MNTLRQSAACEFILTVIDEGLFKLSTLLFKLELTEK